MGANSVRVFITKVAAIILQYSKLLKDLVT